MERNLSRRLGAAAFAGGIVLGSVAEHTRTPQANAHEFRPTPKVAKRLNQQPTAPTPTTINNNIGVELNSGMNAASSNTGGDVQLVYPTPISTPTSTPIPPITHYEQAPSERDETIGQMSKPVVLLALLSLVILSTGSAVVAYRRR